MSDKFKSLIEIKLNYYKELALNDKANSPYRSLSSIGCWNSEFFFVEYRNILEKSSKLRRPIRQYIIKLCSGIFAKLLIEKVLSAKIRSDE